MKIRSTTTTTKNKHKYNELKSVFDDHEMQENKQTTEFENIFEPGSPFLSLFPQKIGKDRHQLLYQAICNRGVCVEDYQYGVRLVFTKEILAQLFNTLQYKDRIQLNQLYPQDIGCIGAACAEYKEKNDAPILGFCFKDVLGCIQLKNSVSRAGTLDKLKRLLKEYAPFLMSLDLSDNQLTDEEGAEVMNALLSLTSPLINEINLSGNTLGRDTLERLQSYLKPASFLRKLDVASCELNDEQFKKLLSTLPQVQQVDASFNHLSDQTELFLRENLQIAYSPALHPNDWQKPCQELLHVTLDGMINDVFMQKIPSLLKQREAQAQNWREEKLLSVAGKTNTIFEAVKNGEVFWLEALVFAQDYRVNVDQTEGLSFKNYDQEIKILEEKLVTLQTRYLEAMENHELLKDQAILLANYLKGKLNVQGEEHLKITSMFDLKNALEDRLNAYGKMKLSSEDEELDAHFGKELVQVRNEMQKEIQAVILKDYQITVLANTEEVNQLYCTQQAKMKSFQAEMAEHKKQEAHYYQRHQDLVKQKKERIESWKSSCMQGKLPLVWMRQLRMNEQELTERLLNHPFDPSSVEKKSGESLLHMAIGHDQLEVVNLLLKAGANIAIRDRKKKTVIEVAIELTKKERRLLHLKAIIEHMGRMKVDNNSLEPLFLLAYGKAAEEALKQMLDVCKHYGQDIIKEQELSGLKGFFNAILSSASVRSARGRELSEYWESLWRNGSKGEVRQLVEKWETIAKNAKSGFLGLSNKTLHHKAQAALRDFNVHTNSGTVESKIHKAKEEQGIQKELHRQISIRCQKIVQQSETRDEESRRSREERAEQEKMNAEIAKLTADKLEADKKQQEADKELKAFKADKLETDKKIETLIADKLEADKKIETLAADKLETDKKIETLAADKLEADKKFETLAADKLEADKKFETLAADKLETDKKFETLAADKLEADKKQQETDKKLQKFETLIADRFPQVSELKAQQKAPTEESKQEPGKQKKKVKTRLAPVEEAPATPRGGSPLLFPGIKATPIDPLKNNPATTRHYGYY